MLSDAPAEAHSTVLEQYGEALGLAFQLSDDIMDADRDPGAWARSRARTCGRASTRSRSCTRSAGLGASALREVLQDGPPSGSGWTGRSGS